MKRLYKSRKNKMLSGVCGGIAEYFSWDPTIVRLVAVFLFIFKGFGVLAYIIAAVLIPYNEEIDYETGNIDNLKSANYTEEKTEKKSERTANSVPHTDEEFNDFFRK